ncbi:MAG: sensor domain-containing protein, partial [Pseudoxanthomonas sp.]
ERMPRRPLYTPRGKGWLERIKDMFTDVRTWTAMLYFLLMLPLGIAYFTVAVTGLAVSVSLIVLPIGLLFGLGSHLFADGTQLVYSGQPWEFPLVVLGGIALLFVTLHLARALGKLHGLLAKHLLVYNPVV